MKNLADAPKIGPFAVKTNLAENPAFCQENLLRVLIINSSVTTAPLTEEICRERRGAYSW